MIRWTLVFLILGLVAAAMGFGGIATSAVGIAKILFLVFLAIIAVDVIQKLLLGSRIR